MSFTVFYFQRLKAWWRTRRILLKSCMFKKSHFFSRISSRGNVDPRDLTNWNSRQSFGLNFFSRFSSLFILAFKFNKDCNIFFQIWIEQILQNSCASLARFPLHLCKLWLECLSRWHFFYSCMSSIWQRLWRNIFILSCDKRRWILKL